MTRRLLIAAALLAAATAASAADQKIIVPVYYTGPGAGTTWHTLLIINNRSAGPFQSSNLMFGIQCPIPEGCSSSEIPAGEFGQVISAPSARGILLTVPEDQAEKLFFRLLISAEPRNPLERGTELPVVRERDLRTDLISLPYVELRGPVRVRLRVYDPDQHAAAQVRVSLRHWNTPSAPPLASTVVTLQPPPNFFPVLPAPVTTPSYAELDLQAAFAAVIPLGTYFNVDVEPVTAGLRFWAFATLTDNATNDVQTVTPQ